MPSQKLYKCGSLTYTTSKLVMVFFWLFVGGTVLSVCLALPGSLLPVQLRVMSEANPEAAALSDRVKMILLSTIGGVLNSTVCPYISVVSDMRRGKWGRRIPYIIMSLPPLVLSLILFAFNRQFGAVLSRIVQPWWNVTPLTMTVLVLGVTMFIFQFFNMWVNSVIWYLFNDIIPPEYFSRVMAVFRIGLSGSVAIYHYFFFKFAENHSTIMYLVGAGLYAVGMGLMCFFVREGEYPPLTEEQLRLKNASLGERLVGKIKGFKDFVTDSFCHRVYTYRYMMGVIGAISGAAWAFGYFLNGELGINDELLGKINGVSGIVGTVGIMLASVLTAELANRWHPARIVLYNAVFAAIVALPFNLRWLFGAYPPKVYATFCIVAAIINVALSGLLIISEQPFEMLFFPKSKYGAFCAMQALLRSIPGIVLGVPVAWLFDMLADALINHGIHPEFRFRFISVWAMPWTGLAALMAYKVYTHWGKLGGYNGFKRPAPWMPEGHETAPNLPCRPVRPRQLMKSLWAFDVGFAFFIILIPFYAFWQCRWRADAEIGWLRHYLLWPGIFIVATALGWLMVRKNLLQRARQAMAKGGSQVGLLHPWLMLFLFIPHLLDLANIIYCNFFVRGLFGVANMTMTAASLFLLVVAIAVLARMERDVAPPPEPGKDAINPDQPPVPAVIHDRQRRISKSWARRLRNLR